MNKEKLNQVKAFLLIFLLILAYSCQRNDLSGKYEAYWFETYHQLKLKSANQFVYKSEGHLGSGEYAGYYKVNGDTLILEEGKQEWGPQKFLVAEDGCLIELETRFDYCKGRKKYKWGSSKRSINYPQLKESNKKEKEDVIQMLELALTNPEIREYIEDTTQNLIIQEYYQINSSENILLSCFGKAVQLKSKKEIEAEGIEEYLIIDEINVGLTSAMVDLQVMPEAHIGILDFFAKEKNQWKLNNEWRRFSQ